jgi:arylsulfatase A-like enzyme
MKIPSRRQFLRTAGTSAAGLAWFSILGRSKARADAPTGRPNILLVFPDQLRPDWNSLNPHVDVRTPHLASLAAAGMRFERAYCPSPLCAPSRACLAQGKRYGRTGVASNGNDNPDGISTFYQGLRDAGYRVGSIGKADLRKASYDWGSDGLHRVGERVYFRDWGFTDGFDSEGKLDVVIAIQKGEKKGRAYPRTSVRTDARRQKRRLARDVFEMVRRNAR